MKILILGATGLLGNTVHRHFTTLPDFDVTATYRDETVRPPGQACRFDVLADAPAALPEGFDYVINCIGVIKPFMDRDPAAAIRINALFPWQLADWCEHGGTRLIHITSDCVYSGAKGKYVESDPHDALDAYGKTKSLGECPDKAMVLRTSIIGEEIHNDASLLAWAKSQAGGTVSGFATHLWNGVTTGWYAKICEKIIRGGRFEKGLYHVHAADDVSKLELLRLFDRRYHLNLTIKETSPPSVDRTLRSQKALCGWLDVPTVEEMVGEI